MPLPALENLSLPLDLAEIIGRQAQYRDIPLPDPEAPEEPLVNLELFGIQGWNHYFQDNKPPYYHQVPGSIPELLVRSQVAEKLVQVNQSLANYGVEIFVLDAFRPLEVQNYFYFRWFPAWLQERHPQASPEWIAAETRRYWAPGARNRQELEVALPPHFTGGAVDLTLRFLDDGQWLEMGSLFDDTTPLGHLDYYDQAPIQPQASFTALEACRNRRLLCQSMLAAGFAPNPFEWWHYSFGDQMWAAITQAPQALYREGLNPFG